MANKEVLNLLQERLTKYNLTYKQYKKLYHMRFSAIDRCTNPLNHAYKNYGGRGISVCNEWLSSIDSFIDFAINNGFIDKCDIDRIDNDRNYEPSNVRFVDRKTNSRNRRSSKKLTINGVTRLLCEWSELSGLSHQAIHWRIKNGVSDDDILNPETCSTVVVNGIKYTVKELSEKYNIKVDTIEWRIRHGYINDDLIKPTGKHVTINGVTKNINDWASIIGISKSTLSHRIVSGYTDNELLQPLIKNGYRKKVM